MLNELPSAEEILLRALREQAPPQDIRTTVVNLARVAGFVPSKRQPLPGDAIVWKAWQVIKPMVRWEEARVTRAKKALITELTAHYCEPRDLPGTDPTPLHEAGRRFDREVERLGHAQTIAAQTCLIR